MNRCRHPDFMNANPGRAICAPEKRRHKETKKMAPFQAGRLEERGKNDPRPAAKRRHFRAVPKRRWRGG